MFVAAGVLPITSFISPFRADREAVRQLLPPGQFVEIFIDAPLSVCESRDPKSLYKKASAAIADGKGLQFTGLDSPYEAPLEADLHLHSDRESVEECVEKILHYLVERGCLL